jgi:hypothetical protein
MRRVFLTDVSTSTLVWDEGEYLVEFYLMHPLIDVVPHSHPFESLTIFMGGHLLGKRKDFQGRWLNDSHSGLICETLAPGNWHAFQSGANGAVVYSISRWDDLAEKDSATRKYTGEPLGPKHQITLQSIHGIVFSAEDPD